MCVTGERRPSPRITSWTLRFLGRSVPFVRYRLSALFRSLPCVPLIRFCTVEEVKQLISQNVSRADVEGTLLLDVRSEAEFLGIVSWCSFVHEFICLMFCLFGYVAF